MDFVCSRAAELYSSLYVNKHEAKYTLHIVWHLHPGT